MKKYGLQIRAPSQKKQPIPRRASIFDEDDDEDNVEKEIARQASKAKSLKETEEQHKKALEENPSAFAYDEVYDDMKHKAVVPKLQDRQDRKPRYVQHLMKKAEQRQKEHEIVYERKLAKEREKDEHLFSGKEKFITGAYKRKLEEQKKWLAEEKIRELREAKDDVTKKSDLSDFYFNFGKNVALGARDVEEKKEAEALEEQRKAEELRKEEKKPESPPAKEVLLSESQDIGPSRKRSVEPQEEKDATSERKIGSDVTEEKDASEKKIGSDVREAKEAPKGTTISNKKSEDAIAAARQRFLARKKAKIEE